MRLITFAILLFVFPNSGYACEFCSGSAILDDIRAQCFLTNFDERLQKLEKSSRGFVKVDLDECSGEALVATRGLAALIPDRSEVDGNGGRLFLDRARMLCLKEMIELADGHFDPAALVTIQATCDPS